MSFTQQHLPNNIFMLTEVWIFTFINPERWCYCDFHFHFTHNIVLIFLVFYLNVISFGSVLFRLRTMYFMTGNLIWRRNDNNVRRETLKIKLVKETGNYEFTEYLSNSSLNSKYQLSFYVFKTVSLTFLAHWHMISVTEQPKVLQWLTRQYISCKLCNNSRFI